MRKFMTLAVTSVLLLAPTTAFAQTFDDVPTGVWYYQYVEDLVAQGVIDEGQYYYPANAANRAELVKMVIVAIDGFAGYQAPLFPTYDDVDQYTWFYDYIEAATQYGIVNGYTDSMGFLTGEFGPGDPVNRAAAAKIIVNAFSVPSELTPGSPYPDVELADWFHDYVVTATNACVVEGYPSGYYEPANSINRAEIAKMIVLAQTQTCG